MPLNIKHLAAMSRRAKVALQVVIDGVLISFSFFAAMIFRVESTNFISRVEIWETLFFALIVSLCALFLGGVYRAMVRFITGKILFSVGKAALIAAVALYLGGLLFGAGIPRSVPFIFAVFVFLSVGGLRFLARTLFRTPSQTNRRPVIIYGAGEAGLQLVNTLFHGRDYAPVALVDDDPNLQHLGVGGLKVYPPSQIPRLVTAMRAQIVLLAIPTLERSRRREIVASLENLQVEIKTIPALSEIITGKAKLSELRSVSPEDLLGRDPVPPVPELLGENITGRVVLVTGAGGSIGSELCRQILSQKPTALVLFEASEFALYSIEAELLAMADYLQVSTRVYPILGTILSSRRLEDAISAFGVNTIYHAAAYKHVPLIEDNVVEGIRNNVFGTLTVVKSAKKLGVEKLIMISTDKAVRPTNVMGASKRLAELICQAHSLEPSSTVISMVRFGNVLGSSGSVIPRFREQIESGGPVTVTHKDITRYFMTIPEASQLVIQAGAMGQGGDVFVLDMGEPVKILDVAMGMIKLHGLTPYLIEQPEDVFPEKGDIPVCVTGLRKGEKLYEELLIGDDPKPTQHPRIMTASEVFLSKEELMPLLDRLDKACENVDLQEILNILHELPLAYTPVEATVGYWGEKTKILGQRESSGEESACA
ncbi:MAG: polysaccharide biosynthesis protein [Thalassococcus sp.]|uniref:polysaccharide biosynthesis protein n=1 Tax=Thalassococcus sp. TaxID=1928858 RepID=UPI001B0C62A5|nr:nucleoside-diphosphate sugar epimerase/dehydratase [Thalassococcus sp.]MBO6867996.1 polysaccharide biosynthesis protein [Thalassococcus sp.]